MKVNLFKQKLTLTITTVLLLAMIPDSGKAQQIPNFSMYNMNHYLVNPAASGTSDRIPVTLAYRKIWAGIDQSPSIQYLSANMQVANSMGAGTRLFNYQIGPLRKTGIEGTYSYHIDLGDNGETKLSFGLSVLLYQFHLNKSEMVVEDIDDQVFMGDEQMFVPDAGIGTYLYHRDFYVGLSVPQLFQRNIDLKSDVVLQQKQVRHYYLHGGYHFDTGSDFDLEPSVLLKFVESGVFQADINLVALYREMVSFGVSYRTSDAVSFQLGYHNPDLFVGYAYDLVISGLSSDSFGSHEIMFTYNFDNFLLR